MNIAYTKPALTVEAQLRLLESRGMTIEDRAFAERALATVSYYRLSAYSFPYRSSSSPNRFAVGTSFAKVWNNYRFDRRLRSVVLDGIERVEIATRTKLVNRFASQYGPFAYRNASNFASPIDMARFTRTLDFIDEETRRSNEEFVAHFRRTYDTSNGMPLWMAAEVMTFGNMLTFFRMLKMRDKGSGDRRRLCQCHNRPSLSPRRAARGAPRTRRRRGSSWIASPVQMFRCEAWLPLQNGVSIAFSGRVLNSLGRAVAAEPTAPAEPLRG